MWYRALPALSLLAALAPLPAAAQSGFAPALPFLSGGAGAAFEMYRFGNARPTGVDRIAVFTVPFAARTPLVGASALEVSGAYASGRLTRLDGATTTLSGFTDTQLSLTLPLKPQVATVTAVAVVPTGRASMSADEAIVAGVVASELLPFRVSSWGAGGAAGLSGAIAHSLGAVGIGVSAAYVVGREFDLVTPGEFAYRPGNQLRARIALDLSRGAAGKGSLQVTYLHSSEDRLSGTNVFRPGDRVQAIASYAFATGRQGSGLAYAGLLHRVRGTYLIDLGAPPAALNLFLVGGGFRLSAGAAVLLPSVDARILRRADGTDEGEIVGLGSAAELPIGTGLTLLPSVRGRLGRALAGPGASSDFSGVELSLGVRFGGGVR